METKVCVSRRRLVHLFCGRGTSDDRDFKTGRFEGRRLSNLPQRVSGLLTAARLGTDPGVLAEDVVVMPRETAALWRCADRRLRELGNRARFWQRLIRFRQFDWNRSRFWRACPLRRHLRRTA